MYIFLASSDGVSSGFNSPCSQHDFSENDSSHVIVRLQPQRDIQDITFMYR